MRRLLSVRNLLAFSIVVIVAFLTFWVVRNYREADSGEVVELISPQVDLALKSFSYTETIAGDRQWTLKGLRASHDIEKGETRVLDVDMVFYDDQLGTISLKGREGIMDRDHQYVDILGDVVVESPGKYKVYTGSLRFRSNDKMVVTKDPVRIESEHADLSGRGMRFDIRTRGFELLSSVKASFLFSEENRH